MDNEETKSAEQQAEEILKGEYSKAKAEECPGGEGCGVHFRVDETYFDEGSQYARMISYADQFVVLTEDNHELDSPMLMVGILMGRVLKEDLPPRWETSIFHVGDGTLAELSGGSIEERRHALRYFKAHDKWEEITATHLATVSMLEAGLIDVSKPKDV